MHKIMYRLPNHTAQTFQVLDFSYCVVSYQGSPRWTDTVDITQIALGAFMCLLVLIQFGRASLQMYKATKRFEPNRYMNLFVREGMVYFLAYVYILSSLPPC